MGLSNNHGVQIRFNQETGLTKKTRNLNLHRWIQETCQQMDLRWFKQQTWGGRTKKVYQQTKIGRNQESVKFPTGIYIYWEADRRIAQTFDRIPIFLVESPIFGRWNPHREWNLRSCEWKLVKTPCLFVTPSQTPILLSSTTIFVS